MDYKERKALTIGAVSDITGLTNRQIRYFEERRFIKPERTEGGTRKYSFFDVEKIMNYLKKQQQTSPYSPDKNQKEEKRKIIAGQLNAQFGIKK